MANLLLLRDVLVVYRGFCMFYIIKPYFACRWCLLTDGRFYKRAFPLLSWPRYVQMYDDYNFRVKWIFFFFFVNRVLIILISVLFRIIFAEYLCFHFLNKNFFTLTFLEILILSLIPVWFEQNFTFLFLEIVTFVKFIFSLHFLHPLLSLCMTIY